ncbi:hypothetical protein A9Q84_21260 [Halobacteriovorax marinus]|uniref:Uncharacterized protein n=1 Tax=Halobacteriovorax marinus TaxID=97084 RepID=A0A1Y5F1X6_9BACT|nr:hypothetical protein A9Q84_21260 [Halobacteriovorax marinus]
MFKSGLTLNLYDDFLKSFQLKRSVIQSSPYVFVDLEYGDIRFVTSISSNFEGEIVASSVASDGDMELLTTGE